MKIPYVPNPPIADSPEDDDIIKRIRARRGSGGLLKLDHALLHSPPLADGWNSFFGAIRTRTSISGDLRELIMCRIAVCNEAWYEWDQHRPILESTGVLSAEAVESLKERPESSDGKTGRESIFDEKHLAVLEYTDAMTIGCIVPEPVFAQLKGFFSEKEVVEITSTVAAYNCVSRFLVALDVGEMAKKYDVDMSGKTA